MAIVRFYVGQKEEDAIVKLYNKLYSNFDRIPPGVSQPLIKVRSIDDVPIWRSPSGATITTPTRCAASPAKWRDRSSSVDDVSETKIIGGQPRQFAWCSIPGSSPPMALRRPRLSGKLEAANQRVHAGSFARDNQEFQVEAGRFLSSPEDLQQVVVGVHSGRPVYLRDVAEIRGRSRGSRQLRALRQRRRRDGVTRAASIPAVTITVRQAQGHERQP